MFNSIQMTSSEHITKLKMVIEPFQTTTNKNFNNIDLKEIESTNRWLILKQFLRKNDYDTSEYTIIV